MYKRLRGTTGHLYIKMEAWPARPGLPKYIVQYGSGSSLDFPVFLSQRCEAQ